MKKHTLKGNLILLLTAMVWGGSFVSQKVGMDQIRPFTFNGLRTMLGALVLLPVIGLRAKTGKAVLTDKKRLLLGGVLCGGFLFLASSLQNWGIMYTTAGKSGFISAMYIVFVPIVGLLSGKRLRPLALVGIACSVAGLCLLSLGGASLSVNRGDLITLAAAVFFALHIHTIDHFSGEVDGVMLSCAQFFVSGAVGLVLMLLFDHPNWSAVLSCAVPILYAGVMSCGVGYTLQILGQKYTDPASASLIMSLESVFATLAGCLILHESLRLREGLGCALMFLATLIVQYPGRKPKLPSQPRTFD